MHKLCAHFPCTVFVHTCTSDLQIGKIDVSACKIVTLLRWFDCTPKIEQTVAYEGRPKSEKHLPLLSLRKDSQMNDTLTQTEDFATRCQKVLQVARQLFQGNPDWVTFFREVLGVSGAARSVFPSQAEFINFERTTEYSEIQKMVSGLRGRKIPGNSSNEATRVITVRLPESLHEALKAEASDHNTSMNKLCISKLLQVLLEGTKPSGSSTSKRNSQPAPQPVPKPAPTINTAPASFRSSYTPPTPPSQPTQNPPNRFGQ